MSSLISNSGISCVGDVPWGTHFCQFYKTREDLTDSLIPYFKAGLDNNEQCLWVTAAPLRSDDARTMLRNAVPDLDEKEKRGQIEILDHDEWYRRNGIMDTPAVLKGWVKRQEKALAQGFKGLRLTGNTHWVEQKDWKPFVDYESQVTDAFKNHKIIALCSYCLERTHSEGVLDVVRNHEFAVVRRGGTWEMIENSDHKVAKQELYKINMELEARVARRTSELQELLKVRDEFLSIASHEFKTPLASLKLQIDSTLRAQDKGQITPEEVNKRLMKSEIQCRRLDTLVSNLLDISRAGTGKLPVSIESVNLTEVISETVEGLLDKSKEAGCNLKLTTEPDVLGQWDRMRLEQVATNLIGNAIKYAPGSDIEIEVRKAGSLAIFTVSDKGPGIAKKDQHKVFERFMKLEDDNKSDGFGLGLWIVKEIVERFSGQVKLASEVGLGSTFSIELPCSRE